MVFSRPSWSGTEGSQQSVVAPHRRQGYLQSDSYSGYDAVSKRDGVVHVSCLVHARRKFDEAGMRAEVRKKRREENARPVWDELRARCKP